MLLKAFISIITYLIIVSLFYEFLKTKRSILAIGKEEGQLSPKRNKWVIVFSLIITFYQFLFLGVKAKLSGDRLNYYTNFYYGRETGFFLFDVYLRLFKMSTSNFSVVVSTTVLIVCVISFFALSSSRYFNSNAFLFILCSSFFFDSCVAFKQALSCAVASLFFIICIEKDFRYKNLVLWGLIIISCGFHVSGFILIPLYFLLNIDVKRETRIIIIYIIFFILLLFFNPILNLIALFVKPIFPIISEKISLYMTDGAESDKLSLAMTTVKGIPYYLLTFFALLYRKTGKKIFIHYDKYLLLCCVSSLLTLATIYSYWYCRFNYTFIVPMSIMFVLVSASSEKKSNRDFIVLSIVLIRLFLTMRSVLLVYIKYGGY